MKFQPTNKCHGMFEQRENCHRILHTPVFFGLDDTFLPSNLKNDTFPPFRKFRSLVLVVMIFHPIVKYTNIKRLISLTLLKYK